MLRWSGGKKTVFFIRLLPRPLQCFGRGLPSLHLLWNPMQNLQPQHWYEVRAEPHIMLFILAEASAKTCKMKVWHKNAPRKIEKTQENYTEPNRKNLEDKSNFRTWKLRNLDKRKH